MNLLKIALLQIAPTGDLQGNLEKGIAACRRAKELGADIALFPEMWSCGYDICEPPVEEWACKAIEIDSEFVAVVVACRIPVMPYSLKEPVGP